MREPVIHVVIPDTQIEPGDPIDHCRWVGQYLVDQFAGKPNVRLIHLGDHWAMNSLSRHNSPLEEEGRRYTDDVSSGNDAFDALTEPLERRNKRRTATRWEPISQDFLGGNHEWHIVRMVEENPKLKGKLSLDDLNIKEHGWRLTPFLDVLYLDGIAYSHYFVNTSNGRPLSGQIETRLKSVGCSFVQGHQQGLKTGMLETLTGRRRGIVAGSCYLKNESYRGQQARGEWRGILVLHQVKNGDFDLMEVSLSYLCERYEGMPIEKFMAKKYGIEYRA